MWFIKAGRVTVLGVDSSVYEKRHLGYLSLLSNSQVVPVIESIQMLNSVILFDIETLYMRIMCVSP